MNYVKDILSGVAAIVIAEIVCCWLFRSGPIAKGIANSKAIGLNAVAALSIENLLSPPFWIVAALLFWLFFAASHAATTWRVLFFWIPTLTVSVLVFAFVGLWAYMSISVRHQHLR